MATPINFRDDFIGAILDGKKTQTRRPMEPQPDWVRPAVSAFGLAHGYCGSGPEDGVWSPYGGIGDRMKVKLHNSAYVLLKITGVRVEQLNDIDADDAKAEGCLDGGCLNCGGSSYPVPCGCAKPEPSHIDAFAWLWDSIYGDSAVEWHANPWVWVYEFRLLTDAAMQTEGE